MKKGTVLKTPQIESYLKSGVRLIILTEGDYIEVKNIPCPDGEKRNYGFFQIKYSLTFYEGEIKVHKEILIDPDEQFDLFKDLNNLTNDLNCLEALLLLYKNGILDDHRIIMVNRLYEKVAILPLSENPPVVH